MAAMKPLGAFIPDIGMLPNLEPEELADVVLQQMLSAKGALVSHRNYCNQLGEAQGILAKDCLAEGFSWLIANGLIAESGAATVDGWYFVTRAGRAAASRGLKAFRKASELPRSQLHASLRERCHGQYMRGELDTAIFEAYKTLEVAIRDAAHLPASLIGTKLARKAFAPGDGALTDTEAEPAEQQALGDLMAGAIGSYKNPHSHRRVAVTPHEAVEMIILASHLLRIVESRAGMLEGA